MGIKNPKGAVSIEEYRGRIRLRWRYQNKRYTLSHAHLTEVNLLAARKLALQIEQDMILNQFDFSLYRYSGKKKQVKTPTDFTGLFEYWVKNYKQMDCEVHTNYNSTRNMIRKWGKVDAGNIVNKFNAELNVPVTYNRRLTILRSFADWLVEQECWKFNPLQSVQRKKVKTVKHSKREPFTKEEIKRILDALAKDTFCSKYASTKHSYYYPFLYFLFKTGVRNAEAIGLRVKHIDTNQNIICIKEVLARIVNSSSSKSRVRKSTKNDKERLLPLTSDLRDVLLPLINGKCPDDLVFLSPSGKILDDHNFQNRVFKKVLRGLGIKERVLYACRHTFGSRCIDEGLTPVMTAFLMGNNPETALRNYTHQINLPKDLPRI
ncbi:MAG: tyrosine recombinase XerC [Sphingobacteriales bacterium]|jgi:integrase